MAEPKRLSVHIRWQGGASTDLSVPLLRKTLDQLRHPPAIVERVREPAQNLPDAQIADQLNRENHVSTTRGKPYTRSTVRCIRLRHHIQGAAVKTPEELTVQQVAKQFGVTKSAVYDRIHKGMIKARRFNNDVSTHSIGRVSPESTPVERKALALVLRSA